MPPLSSAEDWTKDADGGDCLMELHWRPSATAHSSSFRHSDGRVRRRFSCCLTSGATPTVLEDVEMKLTVTKDAGLGADHPR
jgi:hypothetical protein